MYAENDDALEHGISQITILMGRTVSEHVSLPIYSTNHNEAYALLLLQYTSHYLTYCYVHPEEVEDPNLTFKFHKRAQKDSYGIVKVRYIYIIYTHIH